MSKKEKQEVETSVIVIALTQGNKGEPEPAMDKITQDMKYALSQGVRKASRGYNKGAVIYIFGSSDMMETSEEWQIGKHYCAGKSFIYYRTMGISDANLQKKVSLIQSVHQMMMDCIGNYLNPVF